MKANVFIVCLVLLKLNCISSQNTINVINTDRPDQSDGSHVVEPNHFQIETGLQFSKLDENQNALDNVTLIRFGVVKRFEVRLLNQYTSITDAKNNSVSGFQPLTVSFKNILWWQRGILPKVTIISYFKLPVTISNSFEGKNLGYTFILAMRHQLSSNIKMYSNFGITQDQVTKEKSYLSALEINCNLTDTFAAFIEYFGNYANKINASNGMDIGFIYALKNNLTIDLALGSPTLKLGSNRYITFGMSIRLPD